MVEGFLEIVIPDNPDVRVSFFKCGPNYPVFFGRIGVSH
jgi:hypothetical protein